MCFCFGSNPSDDDDDVFFATLKREKLPIDSKTIEKAKKNESSSLFLIGDEYYRKGLVNDDDTASLWFRRAHTWYTKAADEGHPDAQFNLGYMYEHCIGVSQQDYTRAIEYYIKASTLGYTTAFYRMGYLYEKGTGVDYNMEMAFEWYEKAAEQGDIFSQYKVASMYKSGTGIPVDMVKALTWFTYCANQGDKDANNEANKLKQQGYSMKERSFRQSSVKERKKPISRNNSVFRQHEVEQKMGKKVDKEQSRLSTISKKSSDTYYDCVEFTKPEQSNTQHNKMTSCHEKPNLKDDVITVRKKRAKRRFRASKVFEDDDDCARDLNLDDDEDEDHPENDLCLDDFNENK